MPASVIDTITDWLENRLVPQGPGVFDSEVTRKRKTPKKTANEGNNSWRSFMHSIGYEPGGKASRRKGRKRPKRRSACPQAGLGRDVGGLTFK